MNKTYIQFLIFLFISSCGDKKPTSPGIRGHTQNIQGVFHAIGMQRAQRYCVQCHGTALAGGEGLIPSCYQCHGQNWQSGSLASAPATHSINNSGFLHHTALSQPQPNCEGCHGENLLGNPDLGRPSCFLCHAQKW